jgi:hypothetical protein
MRPKRARVALFTAAMLLFAFAVTPMAFAETATKDQRVQVDVMAPDVLAINFHDDINFGAVLAGQQSNPFHFWISYQNTYPEGTTWSATVTSTAFLEYVWDDVQQTEVPTGTTFGYGALTIYPGSNPDWLAAGVGFGSGPTNFTGSDPAISDPVTVMTAPETVRGVISPGGSGTDDPYLQITPPSGTSQSQYRATLTYTLTG